MWEASRIRLACHGRPLCSTPVHRLATTTRALSDWKGKMSDIRQNRPPPRSVISPVSADALAHAARLDRVADVLLVLGRHQQAERLAHQAHATREKAREARA